MAPTTSRLSISKITETHVAIRASESTSSRGQLSSTCVTPPAISAAGSIFAGRGLR